MFDTTVT